MTDPAFIDATCPKCRARIGWHGRYADRPACQHCGHRPDQAALDSIQERADEYRREVAEQQATNPGWERWRDARVAAGLALRSVAGFLGVSPTDLSAIEQGRAVPSPEMAERMTRLYRGGHERANHSD